MELRRLLAVEADKLVTLVRECYGDTYPCDMLYQREVLQKKIALREMVSVVAVADQGQLIGHIGTVWEKAPPIGLPYGFTTVDAITGVIQEQYQRQGVLGKMQRHLWYLYQETSVAGLQMYAVTTHGVSQHRAISNGAVETGFLIPDFPSIGLWTDFLKNKES